LRCASVIRACPSRHRRLAPAVVPHLHEHLLHIIEAKLAGDVLPQSVQLTGCDLIGLDGIGLGMECGHILNEPARDRRRQF
jgi:hypothetical protein